MLATNWLGKHSLVFRNRSSIRMSGSLQQHVLQPVPNRNPIGELFGGVARGVGEIGENIVCAITRKPPSGPTAHILTGARVL
eukprot:1924216-Prymnesium_polylepis.1